MFGRMSAIPRVLVVEDGRTDRQWLADQLAGHAGLEIVGRAETLADAIAAAAGLVPRGVDAVVIDLGLRDSEGVDAVRDFHRAQPRLPIVVVSADTDLDTAISAMRHGAQDYLIKPDHDAASLTRAVKLAIERKRLGDIEQLLVGVVSHDLRAPLQTIVLACDLMLASPVRSESMVERVQRAAVRATGLVNDLLDATRARLGGLLPIDRAAAELAAVIEHAVEDLRLAHPARTITVTTDGPLVARVDARRIAQVLQNLLGNAIQHSPASTTIEVGLRRDGPVLELSVHNGGEPIPDWLRTRMFEPLERASELVEDHTHSVGLGLFIVHEIVKAHGGAIDVESSHGRGTTVRIRIPTGT
jgi:signal transduction histidine kinase